MGENGRILSVLSDRLERVLWVIVLFQCFFFIYFFINVVMISLVVKFCKRNGHSTLLPTGYGLLLTTKTRICVPFTYLLLDVIGKH